jgi:hypothetical protein
MLMKSEALIIPLLVLVRRRVVAAVVSCWFIVKKDADDGGLGCVEKKPMKGCFW